jgi:ABC-type multidrug transport system ATPase subunit
VKIKLEGLGKHFNKNWLFRNLNYAFETGKSFAITGPNGSGKSTFLKIISGYVSLSEGVINWELNGKKREPEELYQFYSFAAPYSLLPEEFNFIEVANWHFGLKKLRQGFSKNDLIRIGNFENHQTKIIRNFSSGMKQRLKLLLAFYTDSEILLLDEPTSNLDAENIKWYKDQIERALENKLVIIASNRTSEYNFCEEVIDLKAFQSLNGM